MFRSEPLKNKWKEIWLKEENNFASRKELSEIIGMAQSAIQKHINTLKEKGFIERIGSAKGGYWKIIKKNDWLKEEEAEKQKGILLQKVTSNQASNMYLL